MSTIRININEERFHEKFFRLAEIGATQDGGIHRPTFSEAHSEARRWFSHQTEISGLEFNIDGAGNHIARLECGPPGAPALILGSHLDSVPNGGKYDGALGVVAAIEVLQTLKERNLTLPVHLEAIDFTDEEGTIVGLLGSSAAVGKLISKDISEPRGGRDKLINGLERIRLTPNDILNASREPSSLAGYIELHIEQGSRLLDANADIGVVTSIVGIISYRISFIGRADHAGTTRMDARLDASQGASAFTLASCRMVKDQFPDCVVNVGDMEFYPGAFNIVPERVSVSVEFRSPIETTLKQLESALLSLAKENAEEFNLKLEIDCLGKHKPAHMNESAQDTIMEVSDSLGLKSLVLSSGAGHDAQSFADVCPTGMIFVPSVNGASHSAREYTSWQDCINGANVLLQTTLHIENYAQINY